MPVGRRKLSSNPVAVYNRERQKRFVAEGKCRCGRDKTHGTRCEVCVVKQRESRHRLRLEMIQAYGGKCQCPGGCDIVQPEFLAIDHIFNDGRNHRREIGAGQISAIQLFRWLRDRGYPKDRFRLLCHNCNAARQHFGKCAHEEATLIKAFKII
jgi:hypothetical protein